MKVKLNAKATPRHIAELHKRIVEAKLALSRVSLPIEGPPNQYGFKNVQPLTKETEAALYKLDTRLHMALLSLETPLMYATGDKQAPFIALREPDAWHQWLDEKANAKEKAA